MMGERRWTACWCRRRHSPRLIDMKGTFKDIYYALRRIRKEPAFTARAGLTLSLGIGASTAMFGVLNAVLLRPIPFSNPDRLVRIFSVQGDNVIGPSPLD